MASSAGSIAFVPKKYFAHLESSLHASIEQKLIRIAKNVTLIFKGASLWLLAYIGTLKSKKSAAFVADERLTDPWTNDGFSAKKS